MQAGHGDTDSLHRLVMDLHKQLNALQAQMAEETLDGAAAYGLAPADRPLVAAFMAGLNRTAALKFTIQGWPQPPRGPIGRLVIQNDIGTTDAHVIVIHVKDLTVSVTYTDVHPERLAFFQEMLKPHAVTWDQQRTAVLAAGAPFYLATGSVTAANEDACRAYLDFLGSRLVFLIDWNRARKQLRQFLRGPDRVALLLAAAGRYRSPGLSRTRRRAAGQSGDRGHRRVIDAFRRPALRRAGRRRDAGLPQLRFSNRHRGTFVRRLPSVDERPHPGHPRHPSQQ